MNLIEAIKSRLGRGRKADRRFRGAFATYQEAAAAVKPDLLVGYDHDEVSDIAYKEMCNILPSDTRVLHWLKQIESKTATVIDAGGHMGTKFRAFRSELNLDRPGLNWIVYDVPALVREGRKRAAQDGLRNLSFVDDLSQAPPANVLLGSGLLQYVDIPFPDLIAQLNTRPPTMILNKVATREGPTVVTLEHVGPAQVPYTIRNRQEFLASLSELGYEIVDEWKIPEFSHVIPTHPQLGQSASFGYCARLKT